MVEIRPATQKDAEAFYGKQPIKSMRAYVAVEDGKPIGIGGVFRDKNTFVAFSEMKPEMRKYPKDIVRGYRVIFEIIKRYNVVYAIANKQENNARKLITKLGFTLAEINGVGEEVYVWHN